MLKRSIIFFSLSIFFLVFFFSFNSNYDLDSFISPVTSTYISSYYGYREIFGSISFHNGIDFPLVHLSEVRASQSGIVTLANFLSGYGNTVIIKHNNGYKTLYAHLDDTFLVIPGQIVQKNQLIGKVGQKYLKNGMLNGYTTGPHLHFSIFNSENNTLDPLNFITKKET